MLMHPLLTREKRQQPAGGWQVVERKTLTLPEIENALLENELPLWAGNADFR